MSKDFRCEDCRGSAIRLYIRHTDGKWVCLQCIPKREFDKYPGLREHLEAQPPRSSVPRRRVA